MLCGVGLSPAMSAPKPTLGREWISEVIRTSTDGSVVFDNTTYQVRPRVVRTTRSCADCGAFAMTQMILDVANAFADDLIRGSYAITQGRSGDQILRSDLDTFLGKVLASPVFTRFSRYHHGARMCAAFLQLLHGQIWRTLAIRCSVRLQSPRRPRNSRFVMDAAWLGDTRADGIVFHGCRCLLQRWQPGKPPRRNSMRVITMLGRKLVKN